MYLIICPIEYFVCSIFVVGSGRKLFCTENFPIYGSSVCMFLVHVASCVGVAEAQMRVYNTFVSSTKCLCPAQKRIVSSARSVHLQHKMHSSLVINTLVCNVIAYSDVELVLFESWFRNPPKGQKPGKNVCEKYM